MNRRDRFPDSPPRRPRLGDWQMVDRDAQGFDLHGPATGIPWTTPEPEPEGPKELGEVAGRNVKRSFEG